MKWPVYVPAIAGSCLGFAGVAQDQSLREAASSSGILIGATVRPAQLAEAIHAATRRRESNRAEPEDALKWEVVHPAPDSFDFSQGDQIVDFAMRNGMKVRGHTLACHRQNPKWLTEGKYTSAELSSILEPHIKAVGITRERFSPGMSSARPSTDCGRENCAARSGAISRELA